MPRPEETLEELARVAREDEVLQAALERRSAGRSSPSDEALLSALPRSLSSGLSEGRKQQLVDAIQARLAGPSSEPHAQLAQAPSPASTSRRLRSFVAAAALSAVAAGGLLWLQHPRAIEPLSPYQVRVEGSQRDERASAQQSGSLKLRPGSSLRFELRPETDVHGEVRARVFVRDTGQRAPGGLELRVTQERSNAGALRVEAEVPSSLPELGDLVLFVGRADAIEKLAPQRDQTSDSQEFRWPFERAP